MSSSHAMRILLPCLLGAGALWSAAAARAADAAAAIPESALASWHAQIASTAKPGIGCFSATYPSLTWQREVCDEPAQIPFGHPAILTQTRNGHTTIQAESSGGSGLTVGNGADYAAQSAGITKTAVGSFPTVSGVTVTAYDYSLQLNTNITASSPACAADGYSSCYVWQQFIYVTTYYPTSGGSQGPHAFIQNWFFADSSDFNSLGCPSGFEDSGYSYTFNGGSYEGCFGNSSAVSAPKVPATSLASAKLTGASVANGKDTVTFTYSNKAYTVTQSDNTLDIASVWKQSEFNIVGDGGGSAATFNKGSSLTVKIALTDGTTTAPTCLSNAGTTGETNNLTLGKCTASGGSTPSISFTESR